MRAGGIRTERGPREPPGDSPPALPAPRCGGDRRRWLCCLALAVTFCPANPPGPPRRAASSTNPAPAAAPRGHSRARSRADPGRADPEIAPDRLRARVRPPGRSPGSTGTYATSDRRSSPIGVPVGSPEGDAPPTRSQAASWAPARRPGPGPDSDWVLQPRRIRSQSHAKLQPPRGGPKPDLVCFRRPISTKVKEAPPNVPDRPRHLRQLRSRDRCLRTDQRRGPHPPIPTCARHSRGRSARRPMSQSQLPTWNR